MVRLGRSDLDVFPVCLGVAPGNVGGESEAMLGKWLAARRNRASVVLATKVGRKPDRKGLSRANIRVAVEESLERLQTDYIDVYYAHADDPETPLAETLTTFEELIKEGKVRYIAASNYTAARLEQALATSDANGLARYIALQPHYSLVEREHYEGALAALCEREGLSCVPYWALARGFLTGKYRPGTTVDSPRAGQASKYLDDHGIRLLEVLDAIAEAQDTTVAAVALAWVAAQPAIAAPIASARNPEQLAEFLPAAELELSLDELRALSDASIQAAAS